METWTSSLSLQINKVRNYLVRTVGHLAANSHIFFSRVWDKYGWKESDLLKWMLSWLYVSCICKYYIVSFHVHHNFMRWYVDVVFSAVFAAPMWPKKDAGFIYILLHSGSGVILSNLNPKSNWLVESKSFQISDQIRNYVLLLLC